jgi:MoxR-like ATPase
MSAASSSGSPLSRMRDSINGVLLGKGEVVDLCLCALLAGGHILIEDVPGVGKTTLAKALARAAGLTFNRIQFTNDLLPGEILGGNLWDGDRQALVFRRGPIDAQLVLADELNRASPRTQSACLQAMEEREVTVEGHTFALPRPFLVVATQNPLESSGVYPLPESQLDRFLLRLSLGYPARETERELLKRGRMETLLPSLVPAATSSDLVSMQEAVARVEASDRLLRYFQDAVEALRKRYDGLSPRGALGWLQAARAHAYLEGRSMVVPEDVQVVAPHVLGHRLAPRVEAADRSALGSEIAQRLREVPV